MWVIVKTSTLKLALPVAAVLLAGGCATPTPLARHAPTQIVTSSAPGDNVVFTADDIRVAAAGDNWESGRRDALFAVRPPETLFEYESWADLPAPNLGSVRTVTISRTPETVTYFQRTRVPTTQIYWSGW